MSDRAGRMSVEQLEKHLADLATAVAFPPTPDLAAGMRSRLEAPSRNLRAHSRPIPISRSVRRSLLLAAALALLLVGGALAVRFGLDLLSIESGPLPPRTPSAIPHTSGPLGTGLDLGRPVTLDEAAAAADFEIVFPQALGTPDDVYLGTDVLRGQVAFVYLPRPGLPESILLDRAGLLVTQNRGGPDPGLAHKIVDTSLATVERVEVDGAPGVWISGEPHLFWYLSPEGVVIQESRRLVGDTLAWERDGILYRIEGAIPLSTAMEIARSMR